MIGRECQMLLSQKLALKPVAYLYDTQFEVKHGVFMLTLGPWPHLLRVRAFGHYCDLRFPTVALTLSLDDFSKQYCEPAVAAAREIPGSVQEVGFIRAQMSVAARDHEDSLLATNLLVRREKTCLSCGAHVNADGDVPCGH